MFIIVIIIIIVIQHTACLDLLLTNSQGVTSQSWFLKPFYGLVQ